MSAVSKLETPQRRILPSARSRSNASTVSPSGNAAAPVQEIEIEAIGAEPFETALAGRDRAFSAGVVRIHLADYKQAVAPAGDRSRHDFLRAAVAVHLGGVDERHPEVEPERQRGRFGRRARLVLAHGPGAEAERRHGRSIRQRHARQSGLRGRWHPAEDTGIATGPHPRPAAAKQHRRRPWIMAASALRRPMRMPLDPIPVRTVVRGACPHDCPDTCAMLVTVEDGRAIEVRGAPDHPPTAGTLCTKVARYLERTYSNERVLHPMRRVGRKGEGRFERISWDEALDTIAAKFGAIAASPDGPQAIVPYSYAGTMGAPAVRLDGPPLLPSARRVAARPDHLRDRRQGRLGRDDRRRDGDRRRAVREQPPDPDLGQQSGRVEPASVGARAGGEAARRETRSPSIRTAARPRKSATSTSRCCREPTPRSRSA